VNKWFLKLLFSFPTFFLSLKTLAAACCGGGFATPALITGDDRAQLTTSYQYSKIDTDVLTNGIWQKRNQLDLTQTLKIEGAHILKDRYQFGFSIPVQMRSVEGLQGGGSPSSGLADVSLQAGYEFLPDWDYNPLRPKGHSYLALTLPTGKSIYESPDGLDVRGRGFTALGAGIVLTKSWVTWDASSTIEAHQAFEKSTQNSVIRPGLGGSFNLGIGYNLKNLRLGGAITWSQEDPIEVTGTQSSKGANQRFATGSLSASYLFENSWAGTLSYADQTLFGDPTNTSLSKTVAVYIQKRWAR